MLDGPYISYFITGLGTLACTAGLLLISYSQTSSTPTNIPATTHSNPLVTLGNSETTANHYAVKTNPICDYVSPNDIMWGDNTPLLLLISIAALLYLVHNKYVTYYYKYVYRLGNSKLKTDAHTNPFVRYSLLTGKFHKLRHLLNKFFFNKYINIFACLEMGTGSDKARKPYLSLYKDYLYCEQINMSGNIADYLEIEPDDNPIPESENSLDIYLRGEGGMDILLSSSYSGQSYLDQSYYKPSANKTNKT